MTEYNAKVILADKVWRQIDWFTKNWNQEIGALGIVKIKKEEAGEKYFYVEKLLFPKQKVTGATVHFDSEMWGELVKEHGLEGLKNLAFYWHRHPGSASHSGTDEEDTFETFMSPEANRQFFIFYQTAVKSNGDFDEEARIEFRSPIRATLMNKNIEVLSEETPEAKALETECKKILETCIVKEPVTTFKYTQPVNKYNRENLSAYGVNNGRVEVSPIYTTITNLFNLISKEGLGTVEGDNHVDNDKLGSKFTEKEQKVSMSFTNGNATVICGEYFSQIMMEHLESTGDSETEIKKNIRNWKVDANDSGMNIFSMQPKFYYQLKLSLLDEYIEFNRGLVKESEWLEEDEIEDLRKTFSSVEMNENASFEKYVSFKDDNNFSTLKSIIIAWRTEGLLVEKESNLYLQVYNPTYTLQIGDVTINKDIVSIYGNDWVINIAKGISKEKEAVSSRIEELANSVEEIKADKTNKKKKSKEE